jgi:hypothetical protein
MPADAASGQASGAQQGGAAGGQVAALGPGGDPSLVLIATLLAGPGTVTEVSVTAAPGTGGAAPVQTGSAQEAAIGRATAFVQRAEGREFPEEPVSPPDVLELLWQEWGEESGEVAVPPLLGMGRGKYRLPAPGTLTITPEELPAADLEAPIPFPSAEEDA